MEQLCWPDRRHVQFAAYILCTQKSRFTALLRKVLGTETLYPVVGFLNDTNHLSPLPVLFLTTWPGLKPRLNIDICNDNARIFSVTRFSLAVKILRFQRIGIWAEHMKSHNMVLQGMGVGLDS